jgi:hypothetical protein
VIPVILGSLAVYAATAAGALWLANRYATRVRLAPALLLAAAPLLLTGKALLTGRVLAPLDIVYRAEPFRDRAAENGIGRVANPLLVDVVSQMLPWRQAVRESVFAGRLPLWNPHLLAGEPLLAVQQPAVLHPGTWIGFLLPLPQAWTFDLTLRVFLALLCAYVFFRGSGAGEIASLLGAAAWGFSDFLVFFMGYPVTPSVAPFPLLLLGLARLSRDADRRAAGLTVVSLVLVIVAGHPETLLFEVAGGGLFFLFELAGAEPGKRARAVGLSLVAGVLALGLTAVLLLPFVEILPETWHHAVRRTTLAVGNRSEPLLESLRRMTVSFVPHAYGVLGRSEVIPRFMVPAGYAGTLLLPFACAGLGARNRRRGIWIVLGLLGLAVNARLAGVTDLVAALPLFDIAILDYFAFLWIFGLAALAVLGADRLREGYGVRPFVAGLVATALVTLSVTAYRTGGLRNLEMSSGDLRAILLVQILPLLLALGLLLRRPRARGWGKEPLALLLALFVLQRSVEECRVYPAYSERAFYPKLPVLDAVPRGQPVRMAALYYAFTPNVASLYGLEDVRGYEAMLFHPFQQTYPVWSQQLPNYFNRVIDPARPFLSFLNVRYVLSPVGVAVPQGWKVLSEGDGVRLLENPNALERAFVPRHVLWSEQGHLWALERIPDFANDGIAGGEGSERRGWQHNPPSSVRTLAYTGATLKLEIEAPDETFVGTSIPRWPGWKLRIDGKRAPLHRFNLAFLGFQSPPGRHEAELVYLPDGFLWGASISLATLLLCVGLLRRRTARSALR